MAANVYERLLHVNKTHYLTEILPSRSCFLVNASYRCPAIPRMRGTRGDVECDGQAQTLTTGSPCYVLAVGMEERQILDEFVAARKYTCVYLDKSDDQDIICTV